jgi:hypothetical protein
MTVWHAKVYKAIGKYELQVYADTEEEAYIKLEKMVFEKEDLPALSFPDKEYIAVLTEERSRKVMEVVKEIKKEIP